MAQQERLTSLDAFRGATIAGMMLVNNAGNWSAVYPQLEHASWHGWTFTDLIFPFFLFIVGVAMTFSFARRIERGDSKTALYVQVIRRTALIFILGLILNGFPYFNLSTIRIPGVLQRIAVCYGIASVIFLNTKWRSQLIWIVGLLLSYWAIMAFLPVPGIGAGVLERGKNAAAYIDQIILSGHMYAYTVTWDPEGIVSTLPAIATTLFGILTGHFLRSDLTKEVKTVWMMVAGWLMLFLGAIWDMWLPINKNIWTSSYSVFMAGWALVCLGTMYWLIDVKGYKRWAKPFSIYGMNAITVYFLAGILGTTSYLIAWTGPDGKPMFLKTWIYDHFFLPLASPINASWMYACLYVVGLYLVSYIMYKKKWFIRV